MIKSWWAEHSNHSLLIQRETQTPPVGLEYSRLTSFTNGEWCKVLYVTVMNRLGLVLSSVIGCQLVCDRIPRRLGCLKFGTMTFSGSWPILILRAITGTSGWLTAQEHHIIPNFIIPLVHDYFYFLPPPKKKKILHTVALNTMAKARNITNYCYTFRFFPFQWCWSLLDVLHIDRMDVGQGQS